MDKNALMLRDAKYVSQLFFSLSDSSPNLMKQSERIMLRIFHRNNCSFSQCIRMIERYITDSGFTREHPSMVDLISAMLYNQFRQSMGVTDPDKIITTEEEERK